MPVGTSNRNTPFRYAYQWLVGYFMASFVMLGAAHSQCCDVSTVSEDESYKPWFYECNNTSTFGKRYADIINFEHNDTHLELGYCMTYADNATYLMACPYDVVGGKVHAEMLDGQTLILNTTLEDLTDFTCDHLNRVGKHCHKCAMGTGQSIFTLNFGCHSCSKPYRGWALYLLFELVPLTIFIIVVLLIQVSPTKANMKAFVLYSQLITMMLSLSYEQPFKYTFGSKTSIFINILKAAYGIWNLDFFRSLIPHFCVDDDLNNLEVMAFHYISIIYPTLLTILAWIIVELHERGCKLVIRMWKPFRRYLSHYSVTNNPKSTIISFFATIITLSYTKVLYISANLLNVVHEYRVCKDTSRVLFLQPDIQNFSPQHIPFVILATVMLVLFVVIPLLILLLYPIKLLQDKLCTRQGNIQMFVEAFHKCYHDGSNNTRDCRHFSTLYLFFRILIILVFVKSWNGIISYNVAAAMHGIVIGLLCAFKPYKKEVYNYLDIFFFIVFAIALLFAAFATNSIKNVRNTRIFFSVIFLVMVTPLLYASIRVFVTIVKWLKLIDFRAFLQRRRRGYVEIGTYGNETETSSDVDRHENVREKDSFQSE